MVRPLPILAVLCLTLAACGTEPTAPPPDAPAPDAAPEAGGDAAPDVGADASQDAPEDRPVEAGPDATPDAAPDAAAEVGVDALEEAAVDAPAPDVVEDRPVEAGSDAAPPCTAGAMRCAASGGATVEYCAAGAWTPGGSCPPFGVEGLAATCAMDRCYACRAAPGAAGCAATPLCADDADCYRAGLGRCTAGRCALRGPIRCTGSSDTVCNAWSTPTTRSGCTETILGGAGVVRVCETAQRLCDNDEMCPAAFRCDASGFCLAR